MTGLCGDFNTGVPDYLDSYIDKADGYTNSALAALNDQLPTITFNSANQGDLSGALVFNPGISGTGAGNAPSGTVGVSVPSAPNLMAINGIALGPIPEFTESKPSTAMPAVPTPDYPVPATSGHIDTSLDIPDAPDLSFGTAPNLTPIIIPTIVPLDIPDFNATAPDGSLIPLPDGEFNYTDAGMYTNDVEQQVVDRMNQMRDNDWGIPDYIWELAWQQGRDRENSAVQQTLDDIDVDTASRGFMLPQGIQLARRDKALQESLQKTITINREQVMAQEKEKTENFRFHVQQGIAFEQVRGTWYNDTQNRILDSAKFVFNSSIQLFQARVEFFNAQVLIFKTEADVYKIEVDAEVARLEAQKVELEAQKLVSEINKDAVAIYTAEIEALNAKADVYKTQVDAAVSALEAARIEVQLYSENINNYSAQINAVATEYSNYKTQVDAKGVEYQNYSTAAQAFASEVQAYKVNADAQMVNNQSISEHNRNIVLQYDTRIKGINTDLQAQIANLDSQVKIFDTKVKNYLAEAGVSKMNVDATIGMHGNQIQYATQMTQASIQNAKSASETSMANATSSVERTNAIGTLYTGLAGASLAAANVSYGHKFSSSIGCTTSYSG